MAVGRKKGGGSDDGGGGGDDREFKEGLWFDGGEIEMGRQRRRRRWW